MAINTVFIVDEDSSAREGLARLLRAVGNDVREFTSLSEFLETVDSGVSGCLVLDTGVSGLSDSDLQQKLMACEQLPVILVSVDDAPEERRLAQKIKAAGFFRKPVDGTALIDAIFWALTRG